MHSTQFLDHARHPRHVGTVKAASHACDTVDRTCGDEFSLQLRIADGAIAEAAYRVRGCSGAIALGSALCVVLQGRAVDACDRTSLERAIIDLVGAVPPTKRHALRLVTTSVACCLGSPVA